MKRITLLFSLFIFQTAFAQEMDEEVAKQLQNPIADLISVPFQMNFDYGIGKDDKGDRYTLNIQPVIPKNLNKNWKLISRAIVPLISQTGVTSGTQTGLGDIIYEGFFSPNNNSPFIWGVGPVFKFSTGTEHELTSGKWSVGPTAVGLMQHGPWTYGLLAYQAWSVTGPSNRSAVNESYFQPFLNHTNKKAFTIGINAEHVIDHMANESIGYAIVNGSQVFNLGEQKMNFSLGLKHSYTGPEELKYDWGVRAVLTLIFK